MNKRRSTQPPPEIEGLGSIIIQALQTMVSKDASEAVVRAALDQAGLRRLPEDPVVLLAFLSGALHRKAEEKFGEELANALLADASPILERAAEHALAVEEGQPGDAAAPESPQAPSRSAEEVAARRAKPKSSSRRTTDPMGSGAMAGRSRTRSRTSASQGNSCRQTAPGVGARSDESGAAFRRVEAPPLAPGAPPDRGPSDPRRRTLGYEAIVDEPTDGQSGRACGVVAVGDKTLRSIVARILRREGFGVVTAPDGALGTLLARRFAAAVVVVDAVSQAPAAPSNQAEGPPAAALVVLDTDASANQDAVIRDGYARIGAKPLDPASLVRAIEQLLPEGWKR